MAAVVDKPDDGGDESLVAVEPLDDGGDDGLVGRRVQTTHLPGREPDKIPDVPEREDERLSTLLFGDLVSVFKIMPWLFFVFWTLIILANNLNTR